MKKLFKIILGAVLFVAFIIQLESCKKYSKKPLPNFEREVTFDPNSTSKVEDLYSGNEDMYKGIDQSIVLAYYKNLYGDYTQLPCSNEDGYMLSMNQTDVGVVVMNCSDGNSQSYKSPYYPNFKTITFKYVVLPLSKSKDKDVNNIPYNEAIKL